MLTRRITTAFIAIVASLAVFPSIALAETYVDAKSDSQFTSVYARIREPVENRSGEGNKVTANNSRKSSSPASQRDPNGICYKGSVLPDKVEHGCLYDINGQLVAILPLPARAAVTGPTASEAVVEALVKLKLPQPTVNFGPDPSVNKWNMTAVGFPIWLWSEHEHTTSTVIDHAGYTFTLTAKSHGVTFDMGDGNKTRCNTTTPLPYTYKPGEPSPTCGYTYERPSRPGPDYTVTATITWKIDWEAAGVSGTLTSTSVAQRTLQVGELYALLVTPKE